MRNQKLTVWRTGLFTLAAAVMLSACGGEKKPEPVAVPPEVQTPQEPPATPVEEQAAFTAPLTGMPLKEASNRRPLSVMINNAPAARPQSGLSQADIVYEVLAEGGITRLIAIYQSQTDISKIGPIRSIRPYLIDIGESYDGVLVHAGGSPEAYSIIQKQRKQDLDEIGNAGSYFWREKDRKAPHNLYSSDEKLRAGAERLKYHAESKVPSYPFVEEEKGNQEKAGKDAPAESVTVTEGEPAAKVNITFLLKGYEVGYEYDKGSETYKRSVNGKPHIDLNNNSVLEAANVVVLGADHKVLDDIGRLSVDVKKGGDAMLFQRGKVIKGRWVRAKDDVIRFVKDGKEVPFYPGTTYFNIVPNSPAFDTHLSISNP